jgi:lipopolysaccharide/colanic/teichoic acid biosynthesis glycosyltransferase
MTDSVIPHTAHSVSFPAELQTQDPHPSASSVIKRLVDIVGATVGLLILAVLFLPMALLIKLDSPGPIFFRQERFGLRGKPFTLLKFRSMVQDADQLKALVPNQAKGQIFKNEKDPRITRVGQFLRKTSLDEFPQFWNVLMGDMSLVGTRPPTRDEVSQYSDRHWLRLNVKPGMTGEWQVSGRSAIKDFEQIVELDLRYQQRWNLLYDLRLIVQTIAVLVNRSGAY